MDVVIRGHQRCGNNYLKALLENNFNLKDLPIDHWTPSRLIDIKYVYISRNKTDVLKSLFLIKERVGLRVDNFDTFLKTKYTDMFDAATISKGIYYNGEEVSKLSHFFEKIAYTPEDWYDHYTTYWQGLIKKHKNVLAVTYEELKTNFEKKMLQIAAFIGSDRKTFENVSIKKGWYRDAKL